MGHHSLAAARAFKEPRHLVARHLGKLLVPEPDGDEISSDVQVNDPMDLGSHFPNGVREATGTATTKAPGSWPRMDSIAA